ncbi:MAG TPA: twin-arginine translocase subunit TatC [Terriglobia bacterium]|nr:twin-arginine translocase subunit TatC [Terriglobia bacterium]
MATTIQNPPPKNPNREPEEEHPNGKQMSFFEHLEELRQRLIRSILSLAVAFGVCFYFSDEIYGFLARPLTDTLRSLNLPDKLVYTNPTDPFNLYIKLSILAALFLASPFILYQFWLFISPGLYRHEKRYVWPFVTFSSALFISGGYFAYKLAFPAALRFLITFGGRFSPFITIDNYFSLASTIIVGVGLVFELPVIILLLSIFGIVTPKFLLKNIRYAILATAIVAAAIAPTPDWTTLFMFWIPMVGLYIISIGLSWIVYQQKKRKKKHEQQA